MTTNRDQMMIDIFNTAFEGGINYWAQVHTYHWCTDKERCLDTQDYEGFNATISDLEGDDTGDLIVDRAVISKGYRLATTEFRDRIHWSSGDKPPLVITQDTDWDYDAGDADVIVQLGLFGEVIYG